VIYNGVHMYLGEGVVVGGYPGEDVAQILVAGWL
jgi:hypothetical protein